MPNPLSLTIVLFAGTILLLSYLLTALVRVIARKTGFVSRPVKDRWSERVVALGGGFAIHLSLLAGFVYLDVSIIQGLLPGFLIILIGGVIDDIWGINPATKLAFQALAAAVVVSQGYILPIGWPILAIALTIIWIVGMSNAVNLIDNMDGLAAGFSGLAAFGFAILLLQQRDINHTWVAIALAMSCFGFLIHNFYPAKIFMGDAGSLPIGFILAALSTKIRFQSEVASVWIWIPLALLLIVPLFDVALVTVARKSNHRPVTSGGRDHTSHRLVALGLNERKAVLIFYFLTLLSFFVAREALLARPAGLVIISVLSLIVLFLAASFLLDVVVYPPREDEVFIWQKNDRRVIYGLNSLPMPILYIVEMSVDICTMTAAWTTAHFLRFWDAGLLSHYKLFSLIPTLPFLIAAKLVALSLFKLHRGIWRSISTQDVYRIFKAASLASVFLIVTLVFTTRLQDISRLVVVMDWLFTFLGLVGTRAALTAFRRWFRKLSDTPHRAALLGTLGLYPAVQSAIQQEKGMSFTGIIVPDSAEIARSGEPVLGEASQLEYLVKQNNIDILIVATDKFDGILARLAAKGITIRQLKVLFN